jgi:CRP/FNR family transcriptional regulator, anaerobic regulatory protein
MSESGREIVLYRVLPGESCALTTICLLGGDDYSAEAIAETDIEAVIIARAAFDDLIVRSAPFRKFVFASFSNRVTDLFKLVNEIAFKGWMCVLLPSLANWPARTASLRSRISGWRPS